MEIKTNITYENLARAILVLMGEGIDREQAFLILQSIGYVLLDTEILPEEDEFFEINEVNELIEELKPHILGEDFVELLAERCKERYVIGKSFNTKDFFVYDNKKDCYVCWCDTEEEAEEYVARETN